MNTRIDIQTCRDQHTAIRLLLDELSKCEGSEQKLVGLLERLNRILLAHLRLEDDWLYPKLLQNDNAKVAETAKRFSEEMGGLKAAFVSVFKTWTAPGAIAADHDGFCVAWNAFHAQLEQRMQREDDDLYVLASNA